MQNVHILLAAKDEHEENPLGQYPLRGLITFTPILAPVPGAQGHLIINLCDGDTFIGFCHIGWKEPFEYADPRAAGQFLYADGYIDDLNINADVEIEDSRLHELIVENMGRSRIGLVQSIITYDDAINFIITTMRS